MKSVCIFLFALLIISSAVSQKVANNNGVITGNVLDNEIGKALEYTTVLIILRNDSTIKKTVQTGANGAFEFFALPFGYYTIQLSHIGFQTLVIDSIHIRPERFDFNIGDQKLKPINETLQEVIIYAEKPLIENKEGKIIYNVGESALTAGSNTAEILRNMPLVSNDPNGKLLLKGKEPKILIDDKPVDLNAQQLSDLLESLPGATLEKIELMTNPPPQYASEQGGVINIVTKKGRIGTTGKVTIAFGTRGEKSANGNIAYRNKKLNVNTTLSIAENKFDGSNYSYRKNTYPDSSNYFNTDGKTKNQNIRPGFRSQLDYDIDKQWQVGVVVQLYGNHFKTSSNTTYKNINHFEELYKLSTRANHTGGDNININLQPTLTWKGKAPGEVLRIITGYSFGKNNNDRKFFQQFLHPDTQMPTGSDSTQSQITHNRTTNYSIRINYDKPVSKKNWIVSAGITWNENINHNVLNTAFLKSPADTFIHNDLLSNDFMFTQDVFTIRAGITIPLNHQLRIIANAQGEYTSFHFVYKNNNTTNRNSYWNFMPALTIRKDITKEFNISLIYRKSIHRPAISELNPAIDYSDPYNLRFGNPTLDPSLAHNFDLNCSFSKGKYYVNASAGYNYIQNIFNTIRLLQPDGKTFITWQNIDNRREYEASIWGGYTFSKSFRLNASIGYSYNQYGSRQKQLYKYQDGGSLNMSVNYNWMLSSLCSMDGNFRYNSFADPQGRSKSNLTMRLGIQYKFVNRRLTISLNVIDPFRPSRLVSYTYGSNFILENYNATRTKNYRITLSWQLHKNATFLKR